MSEHDNPLAALSNSLADAVERVGPSLVTVHGRERQSASGVVIASGLVLTADHVLEREENLTITTADQQSHAAEFAGRDPGSDLAVLRVAGLSAPAAAQAATARVGQLVLAVGRPTGEEPMASLGIVSAVGGPLHGRRGRRRRGSELLLERYIRTDAIPYPGFSGGPLIEADGAVLGILTTGLVGGVALAVPSDLAWGIGQSLAAGGSVKRGYLGITSQPVHLPEAQRGPDGQERGLLLVRVEEGSPAAQGGLLLGDVLLALDGVTVEDPSDLQVLLAGTRVGRAVPVRVLRGGTPQSLDVTIGERPR